MNDELDWNLLKVFVAVANAGTLTGAARGLGSSQPTVGRQLKLLEAQVGTPLVVRHSRGVVLTQQGQDLLTRARLIDSQMQALLRQARGAQGTLEGTVRLSMTEMVGTYILMPALARLRVVYPDIALELLLDNSAADLLQGEADIAVRMFRPQHLELVGRKVGFIAAGWYASEAYIARCGAPETFADLLGTQHDMVGYNHNPFMLRSMAKFDPRLTRESVRFRTDSMVGQLEAIRQGAGVGVVQVEVAQRFPELVRVLLDTPLPRLDMWLVTHQDVRGGAPVRAVFDGLVRELTSYHREALVPLLELEARVDLDDRT